MDYQCPICHKDQGSRKLSRAVVARMETDCVICKSKIRLNIHPLERTIVMTGFVVVLVLAAFAYKYQSEVLIAAALIAGALIAVVVLIVERTVLRAWPRYVLPEKKPES